MGITGDRYAGTYRGHKIELIRNNWNKTLSLHIDGREVATETRALPHDITLTGTFEADGQVHAVVARSTVHFPAADDRVTVDEVPVPLTREQ